MSDAEARMRDHDAYDLIEEQFNRELDGSLGPCGADLLFGYVTEIALPSGAVVVDAACGEGEDAVELGIRYGFRVTGVDPVPRCVHTAQRSAPPGCPVTFAVGAADQLPLPGGSADLVWCCDVLSLVEDLDAAYREFGRVLKPGGRAVIYQVCTTSLLEPDEAAFLLPVTGCWASAMRQREYRGCHRRCRAADRQVRGAGQRAGRVLPGAALAGTRPSPAACRAAAARS